MNALFQASDDTVRAILTALCDNRRVRAKALKYLDMLEPEAARKAKSVPDAGSSETRKRKSTSALSICVQCGEPFHEDNNREKECRYHSGELEQDYDGDFWADHDERCHGTIDTDEMREEYPDGFVWTCCDKLGSEPGCQSGRHQSNPEKSKKGKYESESEDVGTSENDEDEDDEDDEGEEEDGHE